MNLGEYFDENFKIDLARTDTLLGEDGSGGTWFYWYCTCEQGKSAEEQEHKYRTPTAMKNGARGHIDWHDQQPKEK